jgi:hypothetical protein
MTATKKADLLRMKRRIADLEADLQDARDERDRIVGSRMFSGEIVLKPEARSAIEALRARLTTPEVQLLNYVGPDLQTVFDLVLNEGLKSIDRDLAK